MLNERPFLAKTRTGASKYLCILHNKVNKRLEKPLFNCSKLEESWGKGDDDCGCDESDNKNKTSEASSKNITSNEKPEGGK